MPDADWVGKDLVCALKVCGMRDVRARSGPGCALASAAGPEPSRGHCTGRDARAARVRAAAHVGAGRPSIRVVV
jgi:hypothetical protein